MESIERIRKAIAVISQEMAVLNKTSPSCPEYPEVVKAQIVNTDCLKKLLKELESLNPV